MSSLIWENCGETLGSTGYFEFWLFVIIKELRLCSHCFVFGFIHFHSSTKMMLRSHCSSLLRNRMMKSMIVIKSIRFLVTTFYTAFLPYIPLCFQKFPFHSLRIHKPPLWQWGKNGNALIKQTLFYPFSCEYGAVWTGPQKRYWCSYFCSLITKNSQHWNYVVASLVASIEAKEGWRWCYSQTYLTC